EPLFEGNRRSPATREEDAGVIAEAVMAERSDRLRACRGTYCAAVYTTVDCRLHLIVDCLGVRPLYVWHSDDHVVFASALRILEELGLCAGGIDLTAIGEMACFGYPLGNRTPYMAVAS